MNDNRRNDTLTAKVGFVAAQIILFIFGIPFVAAGLFFSFQGIKKLTGNIHPDIHNGWISCLFGLIFLGVGLGLMFKAAVAGRRKKEAEAKLLKQTDDGTKPWLVRADWSAGKIKSTDMTQVKTFTIMALAFGGFGGFISVLALPKELHNGNYKALMVLIFPLIGIGFLIAIVRAFRAHRRFGDCFFEPAQIPAPPGGVLEGLIQTGARLKLEHELHLKISCIRRTVTVSGAGQNRNRNVQESILWQDEKIYTPQANLPESESGHTGIPVHFKLPADQPECYSHGNESVLWRLDAKAKMTGPDFHAIFDVPVFKVAGAMIAKADEPDPTVAFQESIEQIRRGENSKIKISDGPNGKEFYFPAARNPGTVFGLTLFFLIWSGFTLAAYLFFKSLLFEIVFTVIDILLFCTCLNFWLKSGRMTVDSTGIRVVNHWLFFSHVRNFSANDIDGIETKIGMTSGNRAFYSLQLTLSAGKKASLAGGIASKQEADWLVTEMTKALGRA